MKRQGTKQKKFKRVNNSYSEDGLSDFKNEKQFIK